MLTLSWQATFGQNSFPLLNCYGFSSAGFDRLSVAAVSNLHKHSVEMLTLCWQATPTSATRVSKALHKLLPTAGWPLPPPGLGLPLPEINQPPPASAPPPLLGSSQGGSSEAVQRSSGDSWLPLPCQQAEVAHMLLQQVNTFVVLSN